MNMSRFLTPENWGKQRNWKGGQCIRLDFLPIKGEITLHHEPPEFTGRKGVQIELDHGSHAAFHLVRYQLFGLMMDRDAYMAQASMMSEAEADWEEEISQSEFLIARITAEIKRRN